MILDDGGDATMLVHAGLPPRKGDAAFLDKPRMKKKKSSMP